MRRKSKQAEVLAKTQLSPSSIIFQKRLLLGNQKNNRMMTRRKSKQAEVLAKTKLTSSSKVFPLGLLFRNREKNQQNYGEKEEQIGCGFSRDLVVVLFKYVSIKTPRKIKCIINLQEKKVFRDNFELTSNCSNVVPLGWGPKQGNSTKLNFQGDELIILRYTYLGGT